MMKKTMIVLAASLMTCSFQMKAETAQQILNKYYRQQYDKEQAVEALKKLDKIPGDMRNVLKQAGLMNSNNTLVDLSTPSVKTRTDSDRMPTAPSSKSSPKMTLEESTAVEKVVNSYAEVVHTAKDSGKQYVLDYLAQEIESVDRDLEDYKPKKR